MIYWFVLGFTILFYGICGMGVKSRHPQQFNDIQEHNRAYIAYFIIMSVVLIIIIGLRATTVGKDTKVYEHLYEKMSRVDYDYVLDPDVDDRGYALLQIFFNKIGLSFYAFNMLYAIFNISIVSYLIYKKSSLPLFSYFLYITFGFFVLDLTMVRQTTAMSIVILAVLKDKNKGFADFIKFELMIICAYFIHASAIMAFPVWFMRKIRFSKKTVVVLLTIAVIAFVFRPILMKFAFSLAYFISDKYESYGATAQNVGMKLYAMIAVSVALGLYLNGFLKDRWNQQMFYFMCMVLIIFPLVQVGGAAMRAYFYFYIFMIIYVPNLIKSVKANSDRVTYYLAIALYVIVGLSLYSSEVLGNFYELVPYKFFWQ